MTFVVGLTIRGDSAGAKQAATDAAAALDKLTASAGKADRQTEALAVAQRQQADATREVSAAVREGAAAQTAAGSTLQALIAGTTGLDRATSTGVAALLRQGQALDDLRAKFTPLFAASRQYELALQEIAEAERLGAISAREATAAREAAARQMAPLATGLRGVVTANQLAAGSVGSLAAQFNDIGVMLAAGQSPLQLALQQGTQVAQILGSGGGGAAGAARALGAALLSVVSPVNLLTIGAIAAGAALFQWLFDAGEEAVALADRIEEVEKGIKAWRDAAADAGATNAELMERYGAGLSSARTALQEIVALERQRATLAAQAAAGGAANEVLGANGWFDLITTDQGAVDSFFGLGDVGEQQRWALANSLLDAYDQLESRDTLYAQIEAAEVLRDRFRAAAEAVGGISEAESAGLLAINNLILKWSELRRAQLEATDPQTMPTAADRGPSPLSVEDRAEAARITAELQRQAEMRDLINRYGEDSVQVANARLLAERAVFAAMADQLAVTDEVRAGMIAWWDAANGIASSPMAAAVEQSATAATAVAADLRAAWDAALGVAGTNMAGPISAAAGAAAGLAGFLQSAAAAAWDAAQGRVAAENALRAEAFANSPGGRALTLYGNRGARTPEQEALERRNTPRDVGRARAGSGGGARAEATDVASLIEKLSAERDLLVAMDPVQRALAQHRETLADATAAETAAVREAVIENLRLKEARERLEEIESAGRNAFVSLVTGASSFSEALSGLLSKLAEIAANEAWDLLWNGVGGGGGLGGFLGGLLGIGSPAPVPGLASGGLVRGPGSGTSDTAGLFALSNGEFVVNARATARHRAVLEAMNAGAGVRGMATGGFVGGGFGGGGSFGSGAGGFVRDVNVRVSVDDDGKVKAYVERRADQIASERVVEGVQTFSQQYLPDRIREIDANPRVRGA